MEHHQINTCIIILAAGSSSRMGRSKQLLKIDGEELLSRSVQIARQSAAEKTIVVLGANEMVHRKIIEQVAVDVIINKEWEKGMGNSLKKGITHLMESTPQMEAALIMVCDQPMLTSDHLTKLIKTGSTDPNDIISSSYANNLGVPVLFKKRFFKTLLSIADQEGARSLLKKNKDQITSIEFPGGEIDLDSPSDYENFITTNSHKK